MEMSALKDAGSASTVTYRLTVDNYRANSYTLSAYAHVLARVGRRDRAADRSGPEEASLRLEKIESDSPSNAL